MKVLVIGSGGREHALAWRLAKSESVSQVIASPGNPGMSRVAQCISAGSPRDWLALAKEYGVDYTVVGPEAPLAAGIVDLFRSDGLAIIGPTASAAKLEASKSFAKDIMMRAGIPTARHRTVDSIDDARAALDEFGAPVVLKADGLAAGKGVVVAQTRQEADEALTTLGNTRLVIEEFLEGEEASFIVLADGKRFVSFAPTQDHKAIYDGDRGPNTGGMGAYRDDRILTEAQCEEVERSVIGPALAQMAAEGMPFTGFLYAGLMMTPNGIRVLEFNARMGDPETQPLMHSLEQDAGELFHAAAHLDLTGAGKLRVASGATVCVVLAAQGYPGQVRSRDVITGVEAAEATGATVFHAGTTLAEGRLVTSGGRVLGVTAGGPDLRSAIDGAYRAADHIAFEGQQRRSDIGAKGVRRY